MWDSLQLLKIVLPFKRLLNDYFCFWSVLVTLFFFLYVDVTGQSTAFNTVYTKQELLQRGIYRPSDVVHLLPGWYSYSTDGYTRIMSNHSYNYYPGQHWAILINEQPINPLFYEGLSLNDFPLDIHQVDSIVISDSYLTADHVLLQNVVRFFTSRPLNPSVTAIGSASLGNEINDPGPFKYTSLNSPNIDRLGPDVSFGLTSQKSPFLIQGIINHKEHPLSDQNVLRRTELVHDKNDHSPRIINTSSLLNLEFSKKRNSLALQALRSHVHGFPFLNAYEQEAPLTTSFNDVIMSMNTRNRITSIRSEFQWSSRNIQVRPNDLFVDTVFYHQALRHSLSFTSNHPSFMYALGYQFWSHHNTRNLRIKPIERHQTAISFLQHLAYTGDRWSAHLSTNLMYQSTNLKPMIEAQLSLLDIASLKIGYATEPPIQSISDDLRTMSPRSKDFTGLSHIRLTSIENTPTKDLKRFTLQLNVQPYQHTNHAIGAKLIYNEDGKPLAYLWNTITRFTSSGLVPEIQGKTFSMVFWHKSTFLQKLHFSSHYQRFVFLNGSTGFKTRTLEIPEHRAVNALIFSPTPSFSISILQLWQSKTFWNLEHQRDKGSVPFSHKLTSPLDIRANIHKTLFNDRYYVALGFNNILNKPIIEHPIGAQSDMIFELRTGLQLTSFRN